MRWEVIARRARKWSVRYAPCVRSRRPRRSTSCSSAIASRLEAELARAGRGPDDRIEVVHASRGRHDARPPGPGVPRQARLVDARRGRPRRGRATAMRSSPRATAARCSRARSSCSAGCPASSVRRSSPCCRRPPARSCCATRAPTSSPSPAHLAQFGVLAAAYDRVVHGRPRPRLGLLSNGSEPGKGTPLTREAHALLAAAEGPFQYIGYVEGSDLFRGVVDVVATDGFTGNIVLKTCEGIAEGMFGLVRQELAKTRAVPARRRARRARAARPRQAHRLHRDRRRAARRGHPAGGDRARPQRRQRDRERDPRRGPVRGGRVADPACRRARRSGIGCSRW